MTIADLGKAFHNRGAGGTVVFTLPAAKVGMRFGPISRWTAQAVNIDPNGTDYFIGGSGAGKYKQLASNGASISGQCDYTGTWTITSSNGTVINE